jgi:hypothetical protein
LGEDLNLTKGSSSFASGVARDEFLVTLLEKKKIFKDGNHIHGLGIWEQVLFNVSDISTPELMTPHRLEGHVQLRAPLALRFLQAVELPIGCHDTPTGGWTHLDALAQERGMDAVLSQQGVLLKFADLVSDLKRRLARPFSRPGLLF